MSKEECKIYAENEDIYHGEPVAHGLCEYCYTCQVEDWFEEAKQEWQERLDTDFPVTSDKFEALDDKYCSHPLISGLTFLLHKTKEDENFRIQGEHDTIYLPALSKLEPLDYEDIAKLDACGIHLGEFGFQVYT